MKNLKFSFTLVALFAFQILFSSCRIGWPCVEGEGEVVEEKIQLDAFSEVELSGSSILYLTQGDVQSVSIKAPKNIIELLNREVKNGEWNAKFSKCIKTKETVVIYVTIPNIKEVEVAGSGTIIGKELIKAEELKIEIAGSGEIKLDVNAKTIDSEINGSGDVKLSGECSSHQIEINGSGDVSTYDLNCDDVEVEINGSGDVMVTANQSIDVEINGSGDVSYKGNPEKVNSNIHGSGDLNRKN